MSAAPSLPDGAGIEAPNVRIQCLRADVRRLTAVERVATPIDGGNSRREIPAPVLTPLPEEEQLTVQHTIEIEGEDKPAMIAETVVLLLP